MNHHAQTQALRDREHQAEIARHVAALPLEERRKWREMGLDKVPNDFHNGRGKDVSEREDLEEVELEKHGTASGAELAPVILAEILKSKNPKLEVQCICIATGVLYEGDSESEVGRRHRLTRAAVSKKVKEYQSILGMSPCGPMRKLTVCKTYAKRAVATHIYNDRPIR